MSNPAAPAPATATVATQPAAPSATTAPAADPAAASPAPASASAASPAAASPSPDPSPAPDADDASLNILAAPAAPAAPDSPTPPPAPPPAPDPAALDAIRAAVKPADLGLGLGPDGIPVGWDTGLADAFTAECAAIGLKPEQAARLAATFAQRQSAANADAQRAEADLNRSMLAELRAKFGPDLPRRAAEANQGGARLFGPVWDELSQINAFANDWRIIDALAAYARSTADDRLPAGPGSRTEDVRLATGLYAEDVARIK